MSKYIRFEIMKEHPKTIDYFVINKRNEYILGIIKWNTSWRKYCFYPEANTVHDAGCLQEIIKFIDYLME